MRMSECQMTKFTLDGVDNLKLNVSKNRLF